jgi:hypothetical protein
MNYTTLDYVVLEVVGNTVVYQWIPGDPHYSLYMPLADWHNRMTELYADDFDIF